MEAYTERQLRELARKRVEFRTHLIVYCVVNGALWLIWFFTGQGYMWPIWPTTGWGIGIVLHFIFDYRFSRLLSEEEEYNKLRRQLENPGNDNCKHL
jgi:hypothetical protein